MHKFPAPNPPVVGDGVPNVYSAGDNTPYDHVVIHSAVMPCERGAARKLGQMNQTSTTGSWHYATDPFEEVQCSWDRIVCWAAPPNPRKIHIEMADWPKPWPVGEHPPSWWVKFKRVWRWATPNHRRMLKRTARLTAELLLAGDLPLRFCTAADLKVGKKGWTTHAEVTQAFHQSTHWDPGAWPRRRFGRLVHKYAADLRHPAGKR